MSHKIVRTQPYVFVLDVTELFKRCTSGVGGLAFKMRRGREGGGERLDK
jgi:hypothetical protein